MNLSRAGGTLFVATIFIISVGAQSDWKPVLDSTSLFQPKLGYPASEHFGSLISHRYQPLHGPGNGQCDLYKVGFTQDLYFQYIQYKSHVPELKEFTLCMWHKFMNHSNDHPLFSYAVDGQPRAIYSWISNTDRSSYFSMNVEGQTMYRLNYPLRLNRWYHSCQSWNGKTGEWQIWVNAERVGRGYHNRLVGHTIPHGGVAITGQSQTQTGGGFLEGEEAPKGAGGMLGEITMVQLYSVALTAGKAHRDHRHHHAHEFDKNGEPITTRAPPTRPVVRPQPAHPLLTGGQINPMLGLNLANPPPTPAPQPQLVPGQRFNSQLLNGQFVGNLVTQQLLAQTQPQQQQQQPQQLGQQPQPLQGGSIFAPQQLSAPQQFGIPQGQQPLQLSVPLEQPSPRLAPSFSRTSFRLRDQSLINTDLVHPGLTSFGEANPANVQFIDATQDLGRQLFKRQNKDEAGKSQISSRIDDAQDSETVAEAEANTEFGKKIKRDTKSVQETKKSAAIDPVKAVETDSDASNKHSKRELYLGTNGQILDDGLTSGGGFDEAALYGLAGIGENQPILQQQKQQDEREPAEAEVMAVMKICSGCDEEPFAKALIFGWRAVQKKLYSGAFYTPAVPECRVF